VIRIRSRREIDAMARSGAIIGTLFSELSSFIRPGITTDAIDRYSADLIASYAGARAAFKGLYGFPRHVCTSVNEEIVHGIPKRDRRLEEGDIVSVDVGVRLKGWCADSAWTFGVGEVSEEVSRLMTATATALEAAIRASVRGNHVGDIGAAVMDVVAKTPFKIVRDLVGHGIGRDIHEDPQVPNIGYRGSGPRLRPGMVLAIEPMLALSTSEIRTLDDDWTVVSADGGVSAHFEHTVAITNRGPRILTRPHMSATALEQRSGRGYFSQLPTNHLAGVVS